jgi:hypothetical protein
VLYLGMAALYIFEVFHPDDVMNSAGLYPQKKKMELFFFFLFPSGIQFVPPFLFFHCCDCNYFSFELLFPCVSERLEIFSGLYNHQNKSRGFR